MPFAGRPGSPPREDGVAVWGPTTGIFIPFFPSLAGLTEAYNTYSAGSEANDGGRMPPLLPAISRGIPEHACFRPEALRTVPLIARVGWSQG
jgi:hypothetical protein